MSKDKDIQSAASQPSGTVIRVALLDDHAVVRQGTFELIKREPGFSIVVEASSFKELQAQLSKTEVDILLLDINLPEGNSLPHIPQLKTDYSNLKILAFTAYAEIQYVRQALDQGANGILNKLLDGPAICEAIQRACNGEQPVFSADMETLLNDYKATGAGLNLTGREQEMLLHVAQGLTNQEIARQLCLSVKTVDSHVASLIKKFNVSNRTQLLVQAYAQKMI